MLTDTERAALVEEVCRLIEDTPLEPCTLEELQDGAYEYWMPWRPVANQIIDRLWQRADDPEVVEPEPDAVYDLDTPWALVEEVRSHLNYFLADVNKDGTTEGQIRIGAEYAAAMIATVKGYIRKGLQ